MEVIPQRPLEPASHKLSQLSFPAFLTAFFLTAAWLLLRYDTNRTESTKGLIAALIVCALAVPGLWLVGYKVRRWPRHWGLYVGALAATVAAVLLWPRLTPALIPLLAAGLVLDLVLDWVTQRDERDDAPWRCVVCEHVNEPGLPVCTECSAPARTD